jgi:hypothetical protein
MTTRPPQKLHLGTSRITRGWAGIGIALPLAALCAITRTVAIAPDRRLVAVTHHLAGLRFTRHIPLARLQRVEVPGYLFRRRYYWSYGIDGGEPEADALPPAVSRTGLRAGQPRPGA